MKLAERQLPAIEVQAAIAVMLVQLVHKIVREIPGAIKYLEAPGIVIALLLALMVFIGILAILLNQKWGLILGFINGIWMFIQPILKYFVLGIPDQNGVWWYPLFPWTQSILIIYFCRLAWKRWQ